MLRSFRDFGNQQESLARISCKRIVVGVKPDFTKSLNETKVESCCIDTGIFGGGNFDPIDRD